MQKSTAIAGRLHALFFTSRFLSSSSTSAIARPTSIVLKAVPPFSRNLKALEVQFDNGEKYTYSAEFLRVVSPAADSQRRSASGTRRVVAGKRHVAILSVEPVGNYAIRISFDDLHDTGIYSWSYLHSLGKKKFSFMREYLVSLTLQGLRREPPTKVDRTLP